MRVLLASIAWLIGVACSAAAADYPYAGVWGEAGVEERDRDPAFFGANACYNKFTEQLPDGRFRYYLVDHAKWLSEGKVEYLLGQEGTCTLNAGGKSERCVGHVMGEKQSEWFIAYQEADASGIRATYYENVFYFEKRFNGVPIVRQACPFDMDAIKPYVTGKTIADCTTRCRAFGASEAAQLRGMVDAIKAKN